MYQDSKLWLHQEYNWKLFADKYSSESILIYISKNYKGYKFSCSHKTPSYKRPLSLLISSLAKQALLVFKSCISQSPDK